MYFPSFLPSWFSTSPSELHSLVRNWSSWFSLIQVNSSTLKTSSFRIQSCIVSSEKLRLLQTNMPDQERGLCPDVSPASDLMTRPNQVERRQATHGYPPSCFWLWKMERKPKHYQDGWLTCLRISPTETFIRSVQAQDESCFLHPVLTGRWDTEITISHLRGKRR